MRSEELRTKVADLAATLEGEYDATLSMMVRVDGDEYEPPIVSIESIVFPKSQRMKGRGTALMGELAGWANREGLILSLTPSSDFGGSVTRLRKFYRRFGFVPNRGRNKDFRTRDAMIRYPRARAENPAQQRLKRKLMR